MQRRVLQQMALCGKRERGDSAVRSAGASIRNISTHTGMPADLDVDLMSIDASSFSLSCIEWAYVCML